MPHVAVVMTVYEDRRFLEAAVHGILVQTFRDFELIIVDDAGPPDALLADLSRRDARIHVVVNESNLGAAAAANRGIEAARADIIVRLDADDIAAPTRLQRLVAALDADPQLGLVGSWFATVTESGEQQEIIRLPETDLEIRWCLLFSNPFCQSAVAFRRCCFEAAGRYRSELRALEDYDLWSRMLATCRAGNIPEVLTRYQLNTSGLTATRGNDWGKTVEALQERQWAALGVSYDREIARDLAIFVAGYDIPRLEGRGPAYRTLLTLLRPFLAQPRRFEREEDDAIAGRMLRESIARILADRSATLSSLIGIWRLTWAIDPILALRTIPQFLHVVFEISIRRIAACRSRHA